VNMAPRTPLRDDDPPRTPQRELLATAAERHLALTKHLAGFGTALATLQTDIHRTQREITEAERAIEEAKAAASAHRVAEALGHDSPTPPSVADARTRCSDAKDKLTELRAAQTKLMMDEAEVASQLEVAGVDLRDCVRAVVRSDPATRALVDQLHIIRARFVTLNSAVEYLAANGMTPDRPQSSAAPTMETENAWRQAVAALETGDPDATLPFIVPPR
jgi:hypothetical protein